jgi:hypothetical protein
MVTKLALGLALLATVLLAPANVSAEGYGACVVRDWYTNLPVYWDPDVGPGYAKLNQQEGDYDVLEGVLCTDDVYAALMKLYCACDPEPRGPVQWEIAAYDASGSWNLTGCAASGCEYKTCDGVAAMTCPTLSPGQVLDAAVPCSPWKNHGQYMKAVAHAVAAMIAEGSITEDQGDALVAERARSDCGK